MSEKTTGNNSPKRLYRSRNDRVLGGVCGGIAEYFNVDPTLIRLIWIVFIFTSLGIFAYLIAWILIPEKPRIKTTTNTRKQTNPKKSKKSASKK